MEWNAVDNHETLLMNVCYHNCKLPAGPRRRPLRLGGDRPALSVSRALHFAIPRVAAQLHDLHVRVSRHS